MTSTAKKLLAAAIVFVLALSLWDSVLGNNMHINIDGDEFDGPLGALFGLVLAGGGILIAAVAVTCAAVFVGVLCAGIGMVLVSALVLAAVIVLAAMSPLLLPLLIPVGLYWIFTARARRQRRAYQQTA
ncbi:MULTISPECIES: hypothetical protein [Duganella]|uniref:DUF4064 domain-containing protein n=1 Tax=Duganella zoogloeoides TaxID=75659 RepID=A0ABZ0XW45_9BURK|nr:MULTISPECIES: hypothetical protein [Duganella]KQN67655.1 hypothetical protein ASF04_17885 [Duganella sp. Leaf61]MPQ58504.1 hypothetical protein [Duganella sp. FT27W]WQH03972.1 hypothetical protein SR858_23445 [Duganella zoogloeoides]